MHNLLKKQFLLYPNTMAALTEDLLSEKLRDSLGEFRDSWNEALKEINDDAHSIIKKRTKSIIEEVAKRSTEKAEIKQLHRSIAADAAEEGEKHMLDSQTIHNKRRMSAVVMDAAEASAHKVDDHCDNHVKVPTDSHPDWQVEARTRGASVAGDAATFVVERADQREKMALASSDAVKQAIYKGHIDHHN